jgi:Raf kinase inhibitor-like YbhB/YbcL family protein
LVERPLDIDGRRIVRNEGGSDMPIRISSPAFAADEPIPRKYTAEGRDVSPPLVWEGIPEGTRELALICDDPDAPTQEPWVHWVVYKLPPDLGGLGEGDKGRGVEGINDFKRIGYGGPMPPRGHGPHHYHFTLYAVAKPVPLEEGATKQALLAAMDGDILAEGDLVGTYER